VEHGKNFLEPPLTSSTERRDGKSNKKSLRDGVLRPRKKRLTSWSRKGLLSRPTTNDVQGDMAARDLIEILREGKNRSDEGGPPHLGLGGKWIRANNGGTLTVHDIASSREASEGKPGRQRRILAAWAR